MSQGLRHGGRQCSSSPARCNIWRVGHSEEVDTAAGWLAWRVTRTLCRNCSPPMMGPMDGEECLRYPSASSNRFNGLTWPIFSCQTAPARPWQTRTTLLHGQAFLHVCVALPISALPLVLERFNRVATLSMHLVCTLSCSAAPRRRPCCPLPCQRVAQGSPEWQLLLCGSSV